MDEIFELVEGYEVSEMSDEHTTAVITEKDVDISNIGTIVMGEENSSIITFKMNRYYDGVDLSEKKIKVMFRNSAMEMFQSEVCNVRKSKNTIKFSWIIPNDVTKNNNIIAYICFISENYLLKTKNFKLTLEKSFDPGNTEPTQNWFVTIEGKLDKLEKDVVDNHVYDWAKQPEKPKYTPEEIGAEKAGAADGLLNSSMKYTNAEIARLENTVIPEKSTELKNAIKEKYDSLENKITEKSASLENKIAEKTSELDEKLTTKSSELESKITEKAETLENKKAEKVHKHTVSDVTDFPTSFPASDVHDWAKAESKPSYTCSEVGALPDTTHIPSKLEEMSSDDSHMTVSKTEKEKWDGKSEFSGNYSDLNGIPEIKELTDDLKKKYDDAATLAKENKKNLDAKLNNSGFASDKYLKTNSNGEIIVGEKPNYTYEEVGALSKDTHIPSALSEMTDDENHRIVTDKEKSTWTAKSDFSGSYNDLTDTPEIKQLTDELKEKYDKASDLSKTNESAITKKLNKSGYTGNKWLQTDSSGNIIVGDKPVYIPSDIGAATSDHNHDTKYGSKDAEHTHENKKLLDGITEDLIDSWNNKSTLSVSVTEDGILKFTI